MVDDIAEDGLVLEQFGGDRVHGLAVLAQACRAARIGASSSCRAAVTR